jgi:hypothetical protein
MGAPGIIGPIDLRCQQFGETSVGTAFGDAENRHRLQTDRRHDHGGTIDDLGRTSQ